MENKIDVIDVSKWQGDIDWKKVKASGINQAYMKATQGVGYMDPNVKRESAEAIAAGVQIGYYHFSSLNDHNETQDATEEARWFVKVIKQLPKNTLPIVLDIEENKALEGQKPLSKDEVLAWIKAFFQELQVLGYNDFVLYSYTPFLDANLPTNHGLGGVKLWIAAYTPKPKMPKGWVGYWLWQYSCKGKVEGIKGDVDLNTFK